MDVPPFLAHLRRDRRGLPVPFVNTWGTEDVARLSIAYDPNAKMLAVFDDDSTQTVPDFLRQNLQRQRQCVVQGLCQVCGRFVPWSRRFLVLADMSVSVVDVGGRPMTVIAEPWLDGRCAAFALDRCPGLIRRKRDEHLSLLAVTAQRQTQIVISTGWIEGPLQEQSLASPPAMWAKIAVAT